MSETVGWGGVKCLPHLEGEQRVEAGAPVVVLHVDAEGGAGVAAP